MPAMIVACGRLLTWYSNVQRNNMTYQIILENREEGVAVLRCLQDTFPIRNISLKQWVVYVLKKDPVEGESEGSGGDDNDTKPLQCPWTFPKAHGMAAHVWSTPLMYRDMQNVRAQIIENMHVPRKDAAARSNGQAGWELQAITRNMRESALKTWTPPPPSLETDWASDADVVAGLQHVCALEAATSSEGSSTASPKSVGRSGVNATFRTGTGLRYPVWKVILDFCRVFPPPRSGNNAQVGTNRCDPSSSSKLTRQDHL